VDRSHVRRAIALQATLALLGASLVLSGVLSGDAAASATCGTCRTVASVRGNIRPFVPLVERRDGATWSVETYVWRGREKRQRKRTNVEKVGAVAVAAAINRAASAVGTSRDGTQRDWPTNRPWPRGPPPWHTPLDL
jgi:hypothetical protein